MISYLASKGKSCHEASLTLRLQISAVPVPSGVDSTQVAAQSAHGEVLDCAHKLYMVIKATSRQVMPHKSSFIHAWTNAFPEKMKHKNCTLQDISRTHNALPDRLPESNVTCLLGLGAVRRVHSTLAEGCTVRVAKGFHKNKAPKNRPAEAQTSKLRCKQQSPCRHMPFLFGDKPLYPEY